LNRTSFRAVFAVTVAGCVLSVESVAPKSLDWNSDVEPATSIRSLTRSMPISDRVVNESVDGSIPPDVVNRTGAASEPPSAACTAADFRSPVAASRATSRWALSFVAHAPLSTGSSGEGRGAMWLLLGQIRR
jgi:hypothetical protein